MGLDHASISVERDYLIARADEPATHTDDTTTTCNALLELLGEAICDAEVPTDGTVRLTFGNGSAVELYDSEWNYESYQINVADLHIVA